MGDAEPDPTRNSTRPRARQHLHQRLGLKLDTRKDVLRTGGIVLAGFVGARIVLPLLGRGGGCCYKPQVSILHFVATFSGCLEAFRRGDTFC